MNNRGQSLIEVVVAVGVVILLVTGLIVGSTTSIKGSEFSTYKSRGLKYAQEAMETTRNMRDTSWASLATKSGLWCLDKAGTWSQPQGPSCDVNMDDFYTRSVTFAWEEGNTRMKVEAIVTWQDSGGTHTSTLTTYFTQWR
ncbi:hypothetical protein HYV22_00780 [Candidatus Gottesmanbacteria bacterium]|nr:hypothetical protein [Candidatus Gottesmanbacteria bacterium]